MEYRDCEHNWEVIMSGQVMGMIQCTECHLSIEMFCGHLSMWDYTLAVIQRYLQSLKYPVKKVKGVRRDYT